VESQRKNGNNGKRRNVETHSETHSEDDPIEDVDSSYYKRPKVVIEGPPYQDQDNQYKPSQTGQQSNKSHMALGSQMGFRNSRAMESFETNRNQRWCPVFCRNLFESEKYATKCQDQDVDKCSMGKHPKTASEYELAQKIYQTHPTLFLEI
jgi:hypothetical protein